MAAAVVSAAVYARISSDGAGTGLGVDRQLQDCRKLAAGLGWQIAEEYVDNDVSAFTGKPRPGYGRMLDDLRDGLRDAVLVYHLDRLTRRPIELEGFLEVVDAAKVRHVQSVTGGTNLGSGDGLLVARIMGAVAANESATKSRRIRRKHEQLAASGLPNGGAHRPFGYEPDRVTVRDDEAAVIRTLAERFLAGESLRSLVVWLNATGTPTVTGGGWKSTTVSGLLRSPRIAGLREHRGQVVGEAVWEPIISETEHRRVLARFEDAAASGRRSPRRYLLSGLLRCGKCGGTLFSSARVASRRYVCLSGPDHGGCGKLTVVAGPVEELVAAAVLFRLDTKELADTLAGRFADNAQAAELSAQVSTDTAQLEELAGLYASGQITSREWMTARAPIPDRLKDRERRLARLTRDDSLTGLVGNGDQLRESWGSLNLTRQHAVIRAVIDHAVIGPGTTGARSLDPDRVTIIWRL
jgi:site-specific DNA recombinase